MSPGPIALKRRAGYKPWPLPDTAPLRALQQRRRVLRWEDFPAATRERYEQIARLFTGPVWACGSRVRGDYIDHGDPPEVAQVRRGLGKRKPVSDYDFMAAGEPCGPLPPWADRFIGVVQGYTPIPIPK